MVIPQTFLSYSRSVFSDAVDRHSVEDELKKESINFLERVDFGQAQSRGLFRVVLLVNFFVIGVLIANVLTIRRLKNLSLSTTMPDKPLDASGGSASRN